jgi:hypothetical protein
LPDHVVGIDPGVKGCDGPGQTMYPMATESSRGGGSEVCNENPVELLVTDFFKPE